MAWDDKTRKLKVNEVHLIDDRINWEGTSATVTFTELSDPGRQNKAVVVTLDADDLQWLTVVLGKMLAKQEERTRRTREGAIDALGGGR